MIKTPVRDGTVLVTFELPVEVAATSVTVCGDFNEWSRSSHPLTRTDDGFQTSVELAAGQRCRFRYLLDGARWENDWAADDYIRNEFGGEDSVVDLTDISTPTAPDAPAAGTDISAGTRRRKPPAASDAPAAPAPAAPAHAASDAPAAPAPAAPAPAASDAPAAPAPAAPAPAAPAPAAPAPARSSKRAATGTEGAAKKPAATAAATEGTPKKTAAAPSGTEGAAKKPAATTRRKPATPRQASGKDS